MNEALSADEIVEACESYRQRREMLQSSSDLMVYLNSRVGGETVGDTLIRLSGKVLASFSHSATEATTAEWSVWLKELGERLNYASRGA